MKSSLKDMISDAVLKSSLMPFQSSDAMTFRNESFQIENEINTSYFKSVVRARQYFQVDTLPVLVDLPGHLDSAAGVLLLVVLYLEEVHALEVVHLPPGDSHPVGGHLPLLVHHRGDGRQVQEGEGVLEGAGGGGGVEEVEGEE